MLKNYFLVNGGRGKRKNTGEGGGCKWHLTKKSANMALRGRKNILFDPLAPRPRPPPRLLSRVLRPGYGRSGIRFP